MIISLWIIDLDLTLAFKIGQPPLKKKVLHGPKVQLCQMCCFGPACHDHAPKRLYYISLRSAS